MFAMPIPTGERSVVLASIHGAVALALLAGGCTKTPEGMMTGASVGDTSGSDGDTTTSQAPTTDGDATSSADATSGSGDDTGAPKLDVGPGDTDGCNGGAQQSFSFIWIANSPEGTVSKIGTAEHVEVSRHSTGPAAGSDPSRTSVALSGDVAVLNRSGSVTKIAAIEDHCVDRNGNGTIETSGPLTPLGFADDECVLWHAELPAHAASSGPRAIAWDVGSLDEPDGPCAEPTERLWIGWTDLATDVGYVQRLDGETGALDVELTIPSWGEANSIYGAAADEAGGVWMIGKFNRSLVHVDGTTLQVTRYDDAPPPASQNGTFYGLALAADGTPWISGAWDDGRLYRFDRDTETFEATPLQPYGHLRGIAVDDTGAVWAATNFPGALLRYDPATAVFEEITLPGCSEPVGVSIDVDGFVWVVDRVVEVAYRVDPQDVTQIELVDGLVEPYTYSDMTGAGLALVANPVG